MAGFLMPENQLALSRERVPILYPALIRGRDDIEKAFGSVKAAIVDAYTASADSTAQAELDAFLEPVRRALEAPVLVDAYLTLVPCVETFVSTELDVQTPGQRGLGRVSQSPPRLGGAFREELGSPDAREEFASIIERMILETYAATAAALQSFFETKPEPRIRPAEEVYELWVPNIYVGTKGFGDLTIDTIAAGHAQTETAVLAAGERHNLLRGLRKAKRERVLLDCASFWVCAGAALFWVPIQE